ncbi:hypothetical protein ACOMHN_062606 [Nucella lapillus]
MSKAGRVTSSSKDPAMDMSAASNRSLVQEQRSRLKVITAQTVNASQLSASGTSPSLFPDSPNWASPGARPTGTGRSASSGGLQTAQSTSESPTAVDGRSPGVCAASSSVMTPPTLGKGTHPTQPSTASTHQDGRLPSATIIRSDTVRAKKPLFRNMAKKRTELCPSRLQATAEMVGETVSGDLDLKVSTDGNVSNAVTSESRDGDGKSLVTVRSDADGGVEEGEEVVVVRRVRTAKRRSLSLTGGAKRHRPCKDCMRCFTGRQQAVVVEGTRYDPLPVESGVHQGSVLGPSLFLLYINDLPDGIKSKIRLFADDTMCSKTIVKKKDEQVLQEDLHSLATWKEKWSMEFHPQRCSTLRVSRKRDKTTPAYELHGQTIENVSPTKYLGVNIQENMQWEFHIDSITKKASKTLGFIRRNLKIGNKKTKETAYKALVRPLLEYAASVWDPYTANEIEALEKIQRRAARWVVNRHRQTSCVDTILDSLNWPPLQQRRKKARLETFYKLHHGLVSIDSKYLPKPSNSRLSSRTNSLSYDIPTCTTRYRQMAFFPRTIPEWNKLPQEVVTAESLDCFKSRLASHLQKVTHPTPTHSRPPLAQPPPPLPL